MFGKWTKSALVLGLSAMAATASFSCDKNDTTASGKKKVNVAFVTNNVGDFWLIAQKGCQKAEKDFDVTCDFRMPAAGDVPEQQRIVDDLMNTGIQGIAISPNDVDNQTDFLNKIAKQVPLICQDSDAPKSDRRYYVGTNNFKAGEEAGKLIMEALPDGGDIMLFVGKTDAQNAKDREAGIRKAIEGSKVKVIKTLTDNVDAVRAKANADETMVTYPNVKCLVGLWSYNGPAIIQAVEGANKVGKIKVVCFDEDKETLRGISNGTVYATVVQQPYQFGYKAVEILTHIVRGETDMLPKEPIVDIPVQAIKKDNVAEFSKKLAELTGK